MLVFSCGDSASFQCGIVLSRQESKTVSFQCGTSVVVLVLLSTSVVFLPYAHMHL